MNIQKLIISTAISLSIFNLQGSYNQRSYKKIVLTREQKKLFGKWRLNRDGAYYNASPFETLGGAFALALQAQLRTEQNEDFIKEIKTLIPVVLTDKKKAIDFLQGISRGYFSQELFFRKNIRLPEFIKSLEPEILENVDCQKRDSESLYNILRPWPVALNHLIYNHALPITGEMLCSLITDNKEYGFRVGDTEYQGEMAKRNLFPCANGILKQTQESLVEYFKELLKPTGIKKIWGREILTFMLCLNSLSKNKTLPIKPPKPILLSLIIPQMLCINAVNEYRLGLKDYEKNSIRFENTSYTKKSEAVNKFFCEEFDLWYKIELKNLFFEKFVTKKN